MGDIDIVKELAEEEARLAEEEARNK